MLFPASVSTKGDNADNDSSFSFHFTPPFQSNNIALVYNALWMIIIFLVLAPKFLSTSVHEGIWIIVISVERSALSDVLIEIYEAQYAHQDTQSDKGIPSTFIQTAEKLSGGVQLEIPSGQVTKSTRMVTNSFSQT